MRSVSELAGPSDTDRGFIVSNDTDKSEFLYNAGSVLCHIRVSPIAAARLNLGTKTRHDTDR